MDLLHLVDRLEELVASAQKMPIGNRAIVDRRRMLDIIDQMRVAVPQEVREAQQLVMRQDELRREAEEEARIIVARAEEQAKRLVEAHEVTEAAKRRADEIAAQAQARLEERVAEANEDIQQRIEESRRIARQQMEAADDYAREMLKRLQRQLEAFVRSVESGVRQLEPDYREGVSEPEAPDEEPRREPPSFEERTITPSARPSRDPVPLRRDRPEPRDDDELEDLLRRDRPRRTPAPQPEPEVEADPDVIDDLANPPLDDDPLHRQRREGEEE